MELDIRPAWRNYWISLANGYSICYCCAMWKEKIADLMAAGLSQREIADQVGASQPHICDLLSGKRGKRIGYELGLKIDELHRERCGVDKTAA